MSNVIKEIQKKDQLQQHKKRFLIKKNYNSGKNKIKIIIKFV